MKKLRAALRDPYCGTCGRSLTCVPCGDAFDSIAQDKVEVPSGCTERFDYIVTKANELSNTFQNGNRKDLLAGLEELPPRVAFAVLATILEPDMLDAFFVARFLREMT